MEPSPVMCDVLLRPEGFWNDQHAAVGISLQESLRSLGAQIESNLLVLRFGSLR